MPLLGQNHIIGIVRDHILAHRPLGACECLWVVALGRVRLRDTAALGNVPSMPEHDDFLQGQFAVAQAGGRELAIIPPRTPPYPLRDTPQ